ncbi:hypothetical protein QBC47DRAFT_386521 [Echria macrotheca]|uniref:Uncharacterized protein n=1 Tax=Echria macrotheca TaxID=438768 RepID=A0AAJ0B879_9PEZI|nr:hypothetical protein QBC47DRAFT_386521 [Echria macrotheca]
MFGTLTHLIPTGVNLPAPPKDVPPPTPVNLPQCCPQDRPDVESAAASARPARHLTSVLQGIIRPTEVTVSHLEALGSHVIPNSTIDDLIPDRDFIPDFAAWDAMSADEIHAANESTRKKISTTNLSPGCQVYLERKRELLIPNEAAYRTIRRIPVPQGQSPARLGNSYEFYRYLELISTFWDDTSRPIEPIPKPSEVADDKAETAEAPGSQETKPADQTPQEVKFYRTGAGHQMPPEYRQNIVTSFIKLIAYDFGCNVSAPRTEPRLYITSNSPAPRSSYFSSGCTFIFRTPTTREAARAGIVEGPLAAVSARHTTSFPPARPAPAAPNSEAAPTPAAAPGTDRDSTLDLAREIVAALITAQHRARHGREEKRIGEGAWWATKPRWGGGPGGPIGREIDIQSGADVTIGDKDAPPSEVTPPAAAPSSLPLGDTARRPFARPSVLSAQATIPPTKTSKRVKKSGNLPMYDNYRMIRPPAASWDKKTVYTAIGRPAGAEYDDIFVVSALFHHVSVLRVRVPDRLLAVLDGQPDDDDGKGRSWGRLEVRRSRWFDLFKGEERLQAMQLIWGMMAYLMRVEEVEKEEEKEGDGDVKMVDA